VSAPDLGEFEVKGSAPDLGEFEVGQGTRLPGSSPDSPLDEEHPKMDWWTRARAMNLTANSAHAARWLQSQGWDTKDLGDYRIAIKPRGSTEPWRVLDKSKTTLSDIGDIVGDVATGVGAGIGGVLGGGAGLASGPGAVLTGAGGAALGAGAVELGKEGLGKLAGMDPTLEEAGGAVLREGAMGGIGEGVLRGAVSAAKPAIKGVAKLLQAPAKIEGALSGQTARDQVLRAGQQITTDTAAAQAEKNALSGSLRRGAEDIGAAKAAAKGVYNATREGPEMAVEKQKLAELRDVLLRKQSEREGEIDRVLAEKPSKGYEDMLEEGQKPVKEMLEPGDVMGSKPGEAKTPHEVFRRTIESDVLHPVYIYSAVHKGWPELTKDMSRIFDIPLDKLMAVEGASQRLKTQLFWQKFRKVGPEEFTRMGEEWQRTMAGRLLEDRFGTLNPEAKPALARVFKGTGFSTKDLGVVQDEFVKTAAHLSRGDPEVNAALKAYKEAQVAASYKRAAIAKAGSETLPKINAMTAQQENAKAAAKPQLRDIQDYLDRLKIERIENVYRPKEQLPTRRYPYFGRQLVETGVGALDKTGKLLEWIVGEPPAGVQKLIAEAATKNPRLAKTMRAIAEVKRKYGPQAARAAVYAMVKSAEK
jgi:hypothetical protein